MQIRFVSKFIIYKDHLKEQTARFKNYVTPNTNNPEELLQHIEDFLLPQLQIATTFHLFASSWTGIRVSTLVEMLGKNSRENRETVSRLLEGYVELIDHFLNV